ncbi:DUF2165 domain-containing protein [Pseudomonas sp. 5P_3.1_Bac2]|uniref:DUF2165 domain-containing protein n=1 Tax=Pseudomonas sp. 5P_3.1_Bac2 TaxID=2971617 RepID=UPI0021C5C141|nr:DUF2165 domain-containing protein [Pseudomonas sp. 5P_3.1_Bac2]MCU1716226.1 DUF2165 domain-containing protein [Pseudomonas sp. 5P_3.1_Bac2]
MTVETLALNHSLNVFLAVQAIGLSLWLSIALVNNLQAFRSSVGAVGATMAMVRLRESPAIETPLLARAVASPRWHQLALLVLLVLQLAAALAAWTGSYHLIAGDGLLSARPWLNLALSAFSGFIFAMLLSGLWFGYWIRQEGLQLTHLVLSVWGVLAFFLFNLSWP